MAHYVVRRFVYMVVLLLLISLASFLIIQLPPGDYLSTVMAAMLQRGGEINHAAVALLRAQYGLDLPLPVRYLKWLFDLVFRGDLGQSFEWNLPVTTLIGQRLPLTLVLSFATTVLVYVAALPVGIYSATHQYSPGDYVATFFGFIGVALPNFLIALVLLYVATKYLGWGVIGLFSRPFIDAPWSFAKLVDLLKHLPVPVLVLAMSGTAGLIRTMRATLLDELQRQYVITARSKGLEERTLLYKYPVRIALNPIVSGVGGFLPALFGGELIVSTVLGLPTMGPLLFGALRTQDTYLAGSVVMIISALTVVGVFFSDMLLVVVDPRIRFDERA